MLRNTDPDSIGLGEAIRRVLTYPKLKGKFNSVNADLASTGVVRVEVTEDGFLFVENKGISVIASTVWRERLEIFTENLASAEIAAESTRTKHV